MGDLTPTFLEIFLWILGGFWMWVFTADQKPTVPKLRDPERMLFMMALWPFIFSALMIGGITCAIKDALATLKTPTPPEEKSGE